MSTLQENLDAILLDKNTNLLPENLKAGITCLGVEGTAEIGGSSEGIKQFATEEEMQADPDAKEGDLAVVYREEIQNATVDSKFQTATFPDTVVLDTAITDYIDIRYRAVDSSVMFDCMGSLDSSSFRMDCYTESGEIRISYTSEDGITYTRTDTTGNPVDFGTEIYYEMAEMWNDAIGKFIQCTRNTFEGLYEYTLNFKDVTKIRLPLLTDGEFDTTNKQYNVTKFSAAFDVDKIVKLRDKIRKDYGILTNTISGEFNVFAKNGKLVLLAVHNRSRNGSLGLAGNIRYYSESKKFKIYSSYNSTGDVHEFVLDLDNMTYTDTVVGTQNGSGSSPYYFELDYEVQSFMCLLRYGSAYGNNALTNFEAWFQYDVSETYNATGIGSDYYDVYDAYIPIKSQLTLSNPNELLPGKIAYGKNGVVTGDGSIYDNMDDGIIKTRYFNLNDEKNGIYLNNLQAIVLSKELKSNKIMYIKEDADGSIGVADMKNVVYEQRIYNLSHTVYFTVTGSSSSRSLQMCSVDTGDLLKTFSIRASGSWISVAYRICDDILYYVNTDFSVVKYDILSDTSTTIIPATESSLYTYTYVLDVCDKQYVILAIAFEKDVGPRKAVCKMYDTSNSTVYTLADKSYTVTSNYGGTRPCISCTENNIYCSIPYIPNSSVLSDIVVFNKSTKLISTLASGISGGSDAGANVQEQTMIGFEDDTYVYFVNNNTRYDKINKRLSKYVISVDGSTDIISTNTLQKYGNMYLAALRPNGSSTSLYAYEKLLLFTTSVVDGALTFTIEDIIFDSYINKTKTTSYKLIDGSLYTDIYLTKSSDVYTIIASNVTLSLKKYAISTFEDFTRMMFNAVDASVVTVNSVVISPSS